MEKGLGAVQARGSPVAIVVSADLIARRGRNETAHLAEHRAFGSARERTEVEDRNLGAPSA
jgi:hypothetical protein